jgi:lipoate synthase
MKGMDTVCEEARCPNLGKFTFSCCMPSNQANTFVASSIFLNCFS